MLIETVQRRGFLKQSGEILTTSRKREMGAGEADMVRVTRAYEWLRQEYQRRRGPLVADQALIWGWLASENHGNFPRDRVDRRPAMVRLWVEVPDELILLSDFQSWHIPLNGWRFEDNQKEPLTRDWQRLFDNDWLRQHDYLDGKSDELQAVFPYIKRSWIQKIKYLRGVY